jgi:hypothetical protein
MSYLLQDLVLNFEVINELISITFIPLFNFARFCDKKNNDKFNLNNFTLVFEDFEMIF